MSSSNLRMSNNSFLLIQTKQAAVPLHSRTTLLLTHHRLTLLLINTAGNSACLNASASFLISPSSVEAGTQPPSRVSKVEAGKLPSKHQLSDVMGTSRHLGLQISPRAMSCAACCWVFEQISARGIFASRFLSFSFFSIDSCKTNPG
ncbi:unnamed protein product [Prunus armeniaca]|uniref:Uncharacterized protein n=1 Tax=Prunus armeniaca TaxID=36596 RepID=A0A6J5UT86_PRUAR|nr:unnamed protein product [Prunus armeniaca]CAB4310245.1 unnamed protein product [Prunus armeniaca]